MLTKKDFKVVAEIVKLHSFHDHFDVLVVDTEEISSKLADYFTTQNPRFDRKRFMKACGLGD